MHGFLETHPRSAEGRAGRCRPPAAASDRYQRGKTSRRRREEEDGRRPQGDEEAGCETVRFVQASEAQVEGCAVLARDP